MSGNVTYSVCSFKDVNIIFEEDGAIHPGRGRLSIHCVNNCSTNNRSKLLTRAEGAIRPVIISRLSYSKHISPLASFHSCLEDVARSVHCQPVADQEGGQRVATLPLPLLVVKGWQIYPNRVENFFTPS